MRTDLPSGTVTFLFTDIEGSTKLLDELGAEAYAEALAGHRLIVRDAVARHGGVEVDTQGDAFFVAFPDANAAVSAAAEAQRELTDHHIRVRMGLHTGAARVSDGGYVGADVHLGARIAAAGHGGQILLSQATRGLVDGTLADLGEHRLKDFADQVRIFQVGSERFPPLKTISNTNLPRPASTFIGRAREIADVTALLRDGARLLTLTGPGGTGKSRLSIEAASELVPDFKGGVFWIAVAALRDPALVIPTIAQTVGAKDDLVEFVADREMLLVTDNLEQVVEAAIDLAALVEACPNLRLLTTSRELLRVRGEVEYPVPPLAEPDAVELFAARSGLAVDETVLELCRRLESLPLAVELAAARARVLSPMQILERMSGRLDLLKGGRDADPRQQTLRATIDWSYDLLSEAERTLFARLAVFRGGCTLTAAEDVAGADLDVLQSLVDKSLVRHSEDRFWMLETIREFAFERLEEAGRVDDLQRRHADFFLALAEEAEPHLRSADPRVWLERLGPENDNLRAALDRLEAWADETRALRLSGALDEFWCPRAEQSEGRRHLDAALGLGASRTPERVKALTGAAHLARDDGDPAAGTSLAQDARTLAEKLGDEHGIGRATLWLAANLADQGDFDRAQKLFDEAARLLEGAEDHLGTLFARRLLAWMYYELGDRGRARVLHEANLDRARELGSRDLEASILGALSEYAVDDGRVDDAVRLVAAAIRLGLDWGNPHGTVNDVCKGAAILVAAGHFEIAVRLLASATAWFEEVGVKPLPYLAELNERTLDSCRRELGEAAFDEAWLAGRKLTLVRAAEMALDVLEGTGEQLD